jgi:FMN phosphatase YigB (HAD superfamily)
MGAAGFRFFVLIPPKGRTMMPEAVCFDYRGTLIDHRTNREIPGMVALLEQLREARILLAVVSRFPSHLLEERLERLKAYFGNHVFSSSEGTKLDCIRTFAAGIDCSDLKRICFVDDKPANLLPVARKSDIRVIGFAGSGKYPETASACRDAGIPFADSAKRLAQLLLGE